VATVRGQAALLAGDLRAARDLLEQAVADHTRYPAPAFHADPRVALAATHARAGDGVRGWAIAQAVLNEAARDGTPGRWLLESPTIVQELLALCPPGAPEALAVAQVRRMLQLWGPVPAAATLVPAPSFGRAPPGAARDASPATSQASSSPTPRPPAPEPSTPPLGPVALRLTEREREVMELVARGLSNKHLARELCLSAHTVKRHLANILDKLDCDNRVQAADLWRGGSAG
jgi:LuxR family maltose regulon positive regulatory protein